MGPAQSQWREMSAPPTMPVAATPKRTTSRQPPPAPDIIIDEKAALERFARLRKLVGIQTWVLTALVATFLIVLPFTQPVYLYYALNPDKQRLQMAGLSMPNMTNRAVLSWAVTSITEIMTLGFGDMDTSLPKQKIRFTDKGWKAFAKAFAAQKIAETFKHSQLVLTTAASNTPVILAQFVNADNVYQWNVQMPVIMTYATNNNVTRRDHAVVALSIVRVPAEKSSAGIAIDNWSLYRSN
jgi:hypothetical protein